MYYVYVLTDDSNKVMYRGITSNIGRRIYEHCERYEDVKIAIQREKQLKGWRRSKKNALVETTNPEWKDISDRI